MPFLESLDDLTAAAAAITNSADLSVFCGPTIYSRLPRWRAAAMAAPMTAWTEDLIIPAVANGFWEDLLARPDLSTQVRSWILIRLAEGLKRDVRTVAWRWATEKGLGAQIEEGHLTAAHPAARIILKVAGYKRRDMTRRAAQALALRLPGLTDAHLAEMSKSRDWLIRIIEHPSCGPLTMSVICQEWERLPEEEWKTLYQEPAARRWPELDALASRALGRRTPPQPAKSEVLEGNYRSLEELWWDVITDALRRSETALDRGDLPRSGDIESLRSLLPKLMADTDGPHRVLDTLRLTHPVIQQALRGTFNEDDLTLAAQSASGASRMAAMFLCEWAETSVPPVEEPPVKPDTTPNPLPQTR